MEFRIAPVGVVYTQATQANLEGREGEGQHRRRILESRRRLTSNPLDSRLLKSPSMFHVASCLHVVLISCALFCFHLIPELDLNVNPHRAFALFSRFYRHFMFVFVRICFAFFLGAYSTYC